MNKIISFFKKDIAPKKLFLRLEIQIVLSLVLALLAGIYTPEIVPHISWIGVLFMTLLKTFIAPLLFFSVLLAVISLGDIKKLGSIGGRTIGYYMLTTTLAIIVSLGLMNLLKPGEGVDLGISEGFNSAAVEAVSVSTFMTSLVPQNIIQAFVDLNAMQIVFMGLILGVAILCSAGKKELHNFSEIISTLNNGILKYIMWVVKLTPIGVFSIVSKVVVENGIEAIQNLLPFVCIILIALCIHAVITLPILGHFIGKFNPLEYFKKIRKAILLGFSTSSSSATMGLSMSVAKEKAMLTEEVVNFTLPIGTTVNMNGTALYQAGVALFVAQALGVDLSIAQQLTITLIVIMASVGAAGIPGAGIVILTTVFMSIGLPVEAIGIILAIDRILDMFRTAVNVWGDLLTAKIVDNYYRRNLEEKKLVQKVEEVIIGEPKILNG